MAPKVPYLLLWQTFYLIKIIINFEWYFDMDSNENSWTKFTWSSAVIKVAINHLFGVKNFYGNVHRGGWGVQSSVTIICFVIRRRGSKNLSRFVILFTGFLLCVTWGGGGSPGQNFWNIIYGHPLWERPQMKTKLVS